MRADTGEWDGNALLVQGNEGLSSFAALPANERPILDRGGIAALLFPRLC